MNNQARTNDKIPKAFTRAYEKQIDDIPITGITTDSTGSNSVFKVVVAANGSATVTLEQGGIGYSDNEVLTFDRTNKWGGSTDITVTVNGVNGTGVIAAFDNATNVSATSGRTAVHFI